MSYTLRHLSVDETLVALVTETPLVEFIGSLATGYVIGNNNIAQINGTCSAFERNFILLLHSTSAHWPVAL